MDGDKPVIYFATDHAGFALKNILIAFVKDELHLEVYDCGAHEYNDSDDYPDFIKVAAMAVAEAPDKRRAIILGHSGQGEAIVANRYPGVRAVVYYGGESEIVMLSRQHNDANVLSLGAHFLNGDHAKEIVMQWLVTEFTYEERHKRRIAKIESTNLEQS
jgi:ribose 5-phosphate isomerase B